MWFSDWSRALEAVPGRLSEMLPTILASVSLLLVGCVVAYIAGLVSSRVFGRIASRLETRLERDGALRASGLIRTTSGVIRGLVFWVVFLFFAVAALERLSLPIVSEVLRTVASFLPQAVVAAAVVLIGFIAAKVARHWVSDFATKAGSDYSETLGRLAQGSIIVVALIVGAQQVGLEGGVFTSLMTIILATTLGGLSLAFGLGSGPVVTNILASYYASKAFAIGDAVRVGDVEGIVREIGATSIVIEAGGDRVHLPAKKYCDEICVLVGREQ